MSTTSDDAEFADEELDDFVLIWEPCPECNGIGCAECGGEGGRCVPEDPAHSEPTDPERWLCDVCNTTQGTLCRDGIYRCLDCVRRLADVLKHERSMDHYSMAAPQ